MTLLASLPSNLKILVLKKDFGYDYHRFVADIFKFPKALEYLDISELDFNNSEITNIVHFTKRAGLSLKTIFVSKAPTGTIDGVLLQVKDPWDEPDLPFADEHGSKWEVHGK